MPGVVEIQQSEFEKEVLQNPLPVLVDFWAPWCGPCKMMSPILDELAVDFDGRLQVVKVNVDENNELAASFNVMSIPTMVLFKNGKVVESFTGAQPKQVLASRLEPHLKN